MEKHDSIPMKMNLTYVIRKGPQLSGRACALHINGSKFPSTSPDSAGKIPYLKPILLLPVSVGNSELEELALAAS